MSDVEYKSSMFARRWYVINVFDITRWSIYFYSDINFKHLTVDYNMKQLHPFHMRKTFVFVSVTSSENLMSELWDKTRYIFVYEYVIYRCIHSLLWKYDWHEFYHFYAFYHLLLYCFLCRFLILHSFDTIVNVVDYDIRLEWVCV